MVAVVEGKDRLVLSQRETCAEHVQMVHEPGKTPFIHVEDKLAQISFNVHPPAESVLDAFYHPFYYGPSWDSTHPREEQ